MRFLLASLIVIVMVPALAAAAPPVGWRGDGSGVYPGADPVAQWSDKRNVLWKTEVGAGNSSPLVVAGRVLVTAEPDLLVCLDAAGGKELWRKANRLSDLPPELGAKRPKQGELYGDTTPTPTSDGTYVWVFLNTGIVACYDLDGRKRWATWQDLRLATPYGRTASPVLVGDKLLVHFGPLVCLEAATGKRLWTCEAAKASYGTPAPARIGDVDVVVTPKGDVVRVADGKVLAADVGNCGYTSPVVAGRVVYFLDRFTSAVELPDKAADAIQPKELWNEEHDGNFYASPVVHGGRLYAVDRAANYLVLDAATGKTLLAKTLDLPPAGGDGRPNVYPSLCLAGRHLFVGNDAGDTLVLEPDDQGTARGTHSIPGGSGATPTFSGRRMFLRSGNFLYCIGEAAGR